MEENDNAYEILGVSETATEQVIHKAYIKLCREWHPDKGSTETEILERTQKMFKINAANSILMNPTERAEHDAELSARRRSGEIPRPERNQGSGYSKDFKFSNKPRPSGKGAPYTGSRTTPETRACVSDGEHGVDGINGQNGWDGSGYGSDGSHGRHAGAPTAGAPAGDMKIHIRITVASEGFFEVDIQHILGMHEIVKRNERNLQSIPLKAFGVLRWSATGGNGGAGGVGGNGGRGANGLPGKDATQWSYGSNGGPGGNGGDGGLGTVGGCAGRGGDVEVSIAREDVYLLMRVEGCHPLHGVGDRVNGGIGGRAGRHGVGGNGGYGGRGGSPYYWTTTHRDCNDYVYTKAHVNPGGSSGFDGRRGRTPSTLLFAGANGNKGSFTIKVLYGEGKERKYSARYDLEYDSVVTEQVSKMLEKKTYEFGESVRVTKVRVRNTGNMETPEQRVLIRFGNISGVLPDMSGKIFLAHKKNIAPGQNDFAEEGYLQYTCPRPTEVKDYKDDVVKDITAVTDFDPIRTHPSFVYRACQLGHENKTNNIEQISDFQTRYEDFQSVPDSIQLAYPVENSGGILGRRSLAPMETTILEFKIKSITKQHLGELSKTQRALVVQLYYADDTPYEIPIEKIAVRAEHGKVVDISPHLTNYGKGYRYHVRSLPAGSEYTLQLSFKLNDKKIEVSEKAGLQFDVYLQKIPQLQENAQMDTSAKKTLIQRRLFVASCQPRFDCKNKKDALIVTTTGTEASQVKEWQSLLQKLGFSSQPYSLSRYGHLEPSKKVEEMKLMEAFENKLIILLNDEFVPMANSFSKRRDTCRPSELLSSAYEHPDSTNFLIVGGSVKNVDHLAPNRCAGYTKLETADPQENIKTSKQKLNTLLEKQRKEGFALDRSSPRNFQVSVKIQRLFCPSKATVAKALDEKAQKLARWLQRSDPLRPYSVEWRPRDDIVTVKDGCLSTYEIGSLHIAVGPPRTQNSFSFVEEECGTPDSVLTSPQTIGSRAMMYAVLHATSFPMRIRCCCQALASSVNNLDEENNKEVLLVVKDCFVGDFVKDITNYYHGRMNVKDVLYRSNTIQQLRYSVDLNDLLLKSQSNEPLKEVLKVHLSTLMGALKCVGQSKDMRPWWRLFSRKQRASKHMMASLDELAEHWKSILDDEIVRAKMEHLHDLATRSIRERKKSRFVF